MERDYAPKDVQFFYVYKHLAHPELNGYVRPQTLDERVMHIDEARKRLGSRFGWLCDSMDNDFAHAMGNAPNSEWLLDPEGTILARRDWSNATLLRQDLARALGPVDPITEVEDVRLPVPTAPDVAPTNVLARITKPPITDPVITRAITDDLEHPVYVKLRAEADPSLLAGKPGELYLRFAMDPLYNVHWNNLTEPIRVLIEAPEGVRVVESTLRGPKVTRAEADADPREFVVSVSGANPDTVLRITAHYFACHSEEGWCIPVTHEYELLVSLDQDAGRVIPRLGRRRPPGEAEPVRRRTPGRRQGPSKPR